MLLCISTEDILIKKRKVGERILNFDQSITPILGGIYKANLPKNDDNKHVQHSERPVIVIQNIIGNCHSPVVIVIPITGAEHNKSKLPTHVMLDAKECGLSKDSIALCEQPMTLSKSNLIEYKSTLSPKYKEKIGLSCAIAAPTMAWIPDDIVPKLRNYLAKQNNIKSRSVGINPNNRRVLAAVV